MTRGIIGAILTYALSLILIRPGQSMPDLNKELGVLDSYLTTCQKKEYLLEGVWLAFNYKEKNPGWDILKCFEQAIWSWLLAEGKREDKPCLKATVKRINEIKSRKNKK